ncbi:MAG: GNAT family N-acetyltransferase [Acidimicrobiales bacterium]
MTTIRRLGVDDVAALLDATHLFDEPVQAHWARDFLDRPGHHLLVAYVDDDPVGFVSGVEIAHPDKAMELLVYELGVDSDHRRRGIATALLRALDGQVDARGTWVVTEPDNQPARATYRSIGGHEEPTVVFTWGAVPPELHEENSR